MLLILAAMYCVASLYVVADIIKANNEDNGYPLTPKQLIMAFIIGPIFYVLHYLKVI